MATTENNYVGDGSTTLYSFTFPYLKEANVKVSLDGVDQPTNTYTFANATQIRFNTAPTSNVAIRIYRQTDTDEVDATFFSGSSIRAEDLNDNFLQTLYILQELANITIEASTGNLPDGSITSNLIATGAVAESDLGSSSVTTVKLADGSVTTVKLADDAVTDAKLADGAAVKDVAVAQTSYGGTNPITVTEPSTDTKQINIPSTSNAYGIRHVATGTLPTSGDGDNGDIWYVI